MTRIGPSCALGTRTLERPSAAAARAAAGLLSIAAAAAAHQADTARDPLAAQDRIALIIDDQLLARQTTLLALDDHLLTFNDDQGRRRTLARAAILAIVPRHPAEPAPRRRAAPPTPGVLELTDGQRLPGDLLPSASGQDRLAWSHGVFGDLVFPLDSVASFRRPGTAIDFSRPAPGVRPATDTVYLTNGDRLVGYLASVGDPVRVESDSGMIDLTPERLAGARLANPRVAPQGAWIWLSDGTAARVAQFTIDGPSARVAATLPAGQSVSITWSAVRGISFDAARLIPLARLEPLSQEAGPDRYYAPPVRRIAVGVDPFMTSSPIDADGLFLSGPLTVSWALPAGARRLAFTASLAPGTYPWGECDLVVSVDGQELARRRLVPGSEPTPLSIPAAGRTLTVSVEAGRYGPIRNWVVIDRPLILVNPAR